eukprot:TRINITY_DN3567_c2_g1_i1.p1 TRINITY_DN3567_c2_g1~~TRINITY_DN3567_c2_g1_i1.p1  ORF type:complete len:232 (-),score=46.76 TRINITY_DN3567_c2_g1_i1:229-924(-)
MSHSMHALVFSYLLHHCHGESAAALGRAMGARKGSSHVDVDRVRVRKDICLAVRRGDIEGAMSRMDFISRHDHRDLCQNMRYQQFIELIRDRNIDGEHGALEYARKWLCGDSSDTREQDLVTLLAFENPEQSPLGYWMKKERRLFLAEEVNQAMLKMEGIEEEDRLQRLVEHITVAMNTVGEDVDEDEEGEWNIADFLSERLRSNGAAKGTVSPRPSPTVEADIMSVSDVD